MAPYVALTSGGISGKVHLQVDGTASEAAWSCTVVSGTTSRDDNDKLRDVS